MTAMVKVEVDGRPVEVPAGSMVMEATNRLGIYVPHFCWHPQLSIAANCRMCLVQVEKAPKPMPACATPVTEGMKISTRSEYAKQAQRGVMEFLLINHPLDCPICDQGGECQLQDLAVGYGGSSSRYTEPKRVVLSKPMGPLISAEEMTRCIHCTRCVRFGQEIAGVMELGMIGRGEHAEIVSFVGQAVDSELSGNMIDICPVGALTSKPFRYTARTWELGRRRSVSPHDGLGSNLVVQVKQDRVMRVVPFEQPELNECWLSDKDRFSYEGLNSEDRLTKPMLRQGGEWREVDWEKALEFAAEGLRKARATHGAASIGALVSPHATLEEMHLAQKLARGLGSENVDFRLRQSDFAADGKLQGAPWLGMKVAELAALDRVLVVGSFLRKDHPLIAHRFRQAAKRGQQVNVIHVAGDDLAIKLNRELVVRPGELVPALAQVAKAVAEEKGVAVPPALGAIAVGDAARAIAKSLASGRNVGIFLGNSAQQHPRAGQLHALAQAAAGALGARFGFLGEAANSVGGYLARCVPGAGGLNAAAMLAAPRKAYLLLNVEPELDTANPGQAARAHGRGGVRDRAHPVQGPCSRLRRRAAAGDAVHRDRRQLRQRRRRPAERSIRSSSRAANRARRGRCSASSATCSGSPASTTSGASKSATRRAGPRRSPAASRTPSTGCRSCRPAGRTGSSGSRTCRSTSPTRSCGGRTRCSRPRTPRRRARARTGRCSRGWDSRRGIGSASGRTAARRCSRSRSTRGSPTACCGSPRRIR